MSLESNLGEVYFMQKCQIPQKFYLTPLEHVWVAIVPQDDLG
jgi:hypothetical protein